jgi:hypothetical protein
MCKAKDLEYERLREYIRHIQSPPPPKIGRVLMEGDPPRVLQVTKAHLGEGGHVEVWVAEEVSA